ncbi:hypothetical protein KKA14_10635 [bacterium]|nr:hypothetical protein [bacterium]
MNILNKRFNSLLIVFIVLYTPKLLADISHYKEILVGDRGANMGAAYSAVADDASGAYHNPAGLTLGSKESMISITNATNFVYNETREAVGDEMEMEEGWRYLITFVGYAKRVDNSVFEISYVVDDSTEVHQDQFFDNNLIINRRGDDRTYKYGPTWAYKFSDKFSWGVTLYAVQREYFLQTNRLNNTGDSSSDWSYENNRGADFGYQFRTGCMWSVSEDMSLALVLKKTNFLYTYNEYQTDEKTSGSSIINHTLTKTSNDFRATPLEMTVGFAWFASAYTLIAADFDYYLIDDDDKVNVLNVSAGIEYYINEKNVLRGGIYTNNDNDKTPSSSTTGIDKIDMVGVTAGYSLFNGPTMITAGAVLSYGVGKTQKDPVNPSAIQEFARETYSFSISVSYNK